MTSAWPTAHLLTGLLEAPPARRAVSFPDGALTCGALVEAASTLAASLDGVDRVGIWALPRLHTGVAVCAAFLADVPVVPLNPTAGVRELTHVMALGDPDLVLAPPGVALPPVVAARTGAGRLPAAAYAGRTPRGVAFVLFTSGTTGPPKGVLMRRDALASNLDAIAEAWHWTAEDTIVQALPLFHAYGLLVGILGPLRRGGAVIHAGRFRTATITEALAGPATMLLAVPTMIQRLTDAAAGDPAVARALAGARVLASGAGALPAREHKRLRDLTGARVLERYGMTETLVSTAVRPEGVERPGFAGPPLPGVQLRLVDDDGGALDVCDGETLGEVEVRGPNLFLGYLGNDEATRASYRNGWFRTGDLAARADDGSIRIAGRRDTDLINSGGYRIGAGEVEGALLEHAGVLDAAVTGEPDPDLGERMVAWIVLRPASHVDEAELVDHVGSLLAPHKRPRRIVFLDKLPRNAMGKVRKQELGERPDPGAGTS